MEVWGEEKWREAKRKKYRQKYDLLPDTFPHAILPCGVPNESKFIISQRLKFTFFKKNSKMLKDTG